MSHNLNALPNVLPIRNQWPSKRCVHVHQARAGSLDKDEVLDDNRERDKEWVPELAGNQDMVVVDYNGDRVLLGLRHHSKSY